MTFDPAEVPLWSFRDMQPIIGGIAVREAVAIWWLARTQLFAEQGRAVDLGSCNGKSAMAAWLGMVKKSRFHLVEPDFKHEWLRNMVRTRAYWAIGWQIEESEMWPCTSQAYMDDGDVRLTSFRWAFIDSANHTQPLLGQECDFIAQRMQKGGILAFHDFGNQHIAPAEQHAKMLATGEWENIPIPWDEITALVDKADLEKDNQNWTYYGEPGTPEGHHGKYVGALRKL